MPLHTDYLASLPPLPTDILDTDIIAVLRSGVLYQSPVLQDILYRLSVLEGAVPAPSPTPPPPPAPVAGSYEWDFTAGDEAADFSVVRAGTSGTHHDIAGVIVSASANTARIQHEAGVPVGIYCERARTNLLTYGRFPSTGITWTDFGTPTGTWDDAYSASPDGDSDGATRLTFTAAGSYFGKRTSVVTAGVSDIHTIVHVKANAALSQLGGLPGSWVEPSTSFYTMYEHIHAATAGFNVDLAGSWVACDNSIWGISVVEGGKLGESLIFTNGAAVTRPKEVFTFEGLVAATYDVRVTFPDATEQDFTSQVVAGTTWELDADDLTVGQNIIASVRFDPAGSAPAPAPTPTPPPPPPPPAPGAVWSSSLIATAISTSKGNNDFVLQGMGSNTSGWRGGADLAFGRRWSNADPKGWDWPEGNLLDSQYMEWQDPWFILINEEGSSGDGWIEIDYFDFQYRLNGQTTWIRPVAQSRTIRWCHEYSIDSNGGFAGSNVNTERIAGLDGGTSVKVNQNKSPHGGPGLGLIHVPGCHTGTVNNIADAMVSCWHRKDPRSASTWKGGLHIAWDPKPTGTGNQSGLPYYINAGISRTVRSESSWKFLARTMIKSDSSSLTDRTVLESTLQAYPPLAGVLK